MQPKFLVGQKVKYRFYIEHDIPNVSNYCLRYGTIARFEGSCKNGKGVYLIIDAGGLINVNEDDIELDICPTCGK